ncbi:hypothetical protein [Erwinia sp. 9145]|uniref:hypothetical protein n=1 Tax=Erwinia sp. 9145 TaxID=1500895 RepID=UPI00054CDFA4|nr:hypothetical protein [Erwinia sp. 9145]
MPSPISGRIPVAPTSRDLRDLGPNDRVNIRLALEPGNPVHRDCEVRVSSQQFNALRVANQAIQDTHKILFMGVGDQRFHSLNTNAETFKRLLVMRKRVEDAKMTPLQSIWEAKRYRVGNCGELAMICGQLIASSGLNQPVSVMETKGKVDHTYVVIGDPASKDEKVIADPWALFSRAMLEKNFHYASASSRNVHTFTPQYDPAMKAALTSDGMVSRAEVEREFAPLSEGLGNPDNEALIRKATKKRWLYDQFHASENLGERYRYGSGHDKRYVDQNMTKAEYQEIYNGPRPSAPEPRPARYYPPTASGSMPQRSYSSRTRPASQYAPEADLSERLRRMSTADEPRPRRHSFVAERPPASHRHSFSADRPSTSHRQAAAAEREPRYTSSQSRPVYVEVQPESSHRSRRHRHRDRDREREMSSRLSRFTSFFTR